jgi:hypothetical protein
MRYSVKGLKKAIRALEGSFNDPSHSLAVREYVQSQIDKAKEVLKWRRLWLEIRNKTPSCKPLMGVIL